MYLGNRATERFFAFRGTPIKKSLISHSFEFIGSTIYFFFFFLFHRGSFLDLILYFNRDVIRRCREYCTFKSLLQILAQEMNPGVLYKYMMPFNGKPAIAPPFFPIGNSSRKVIRTIPSCNWLWAKHRMIFEWFGILPFSQDPSIAATKSPIRMLASGQPFRSLECKYSQIFTPVKFVLSRSIIRISWTKRFVRQGRKALSPFQIQSKSRFITDDS